MEILQNETQENGYPEITDAVYDPQTIRIIKNLMSSKGSEFSAISTYTYQYFILKPYYPDIANEIERISQTEMLHFELLGDALVDFGGDPNLTSGDGVCWNCRFANYTKNITQLLKNNIRAEELAIAEYTTSAARVLNKSLSDLFLRLAVDEMAHKKQFERILISISE